MGGVPGAGLRAADRPWECAGADGAGTGQGPCAFGDMPHRQGAGRVRVLRALPRAVLRGRPALVGGVRDTPFPPCRCPRYPQHRHDPLRGGQRDPGR